MRRKLALLSKAQNCRIDKSRYRLFSAVLEKHCCRVAMRRISSTRVREQSLFMEPE
jgi:phage gp36-like protein